MRPCLHRPRIANPKQAQAKPSVQLRPQLADGKICPLTIQRETGVVEKPLATMRQEVALIDGLADVLNGALIELGDSQRAASLDQLYTLFSKRVQSVLVTLAKHSQAP